MTETTNQKKYRLIHDSKARFNKSCKEAFTNYAENHYTLDQYLGTIQLAMRRHGHEVRAITHE